MSVMDVVHVCTYTKGLWGRNQKHVLSVHSVGIDKVQSWAYHHGKVLGNTTNTTRTPPASQAGRIREDRHPRLSRFSGGKDQDKVGVSGLDVSSSWRSTRVGLTSVKGPIIDMYVHGSILLRPDVKT